MLVLHMPAASRAALGLRKLLALKDLPYGLVTDGPSLGETAEMPSLQWGRRIFVGPTLAAIAVEAARETPTLFPNGNRGMPLVLGFWSEAACRRARQEDAARAAHAGLVARQLEDGRAFLQGAAPGLADIEAWSFLAVCGGPDASPPALARWYGRVEALGSGRATSMRAGDCARLAPVPKADSLDLGSLADAVRRHDPALGNVILARPRL